MKLLYLDESGDHNLVKIDPKYPSFVLGGIIVDRTYARTTLRHRVRQLKLEYFGNQNLVLHTNDILRARNGFEILLEPALRTRFYEALNALMSELEYLVVACVIDKPRLVAKHGPKAEDPYHYSLHVLIERFCTELEQSTDSGIIYAEKRGEPLDYELSETWEQLRTNVIRSGDARGATIDDRICELVLKEKKLNMEGLQLADLVISPIARRAMQLSTGTDWEIVERKFQRSPNGVVRGHGLNYLP